MPRALRPSLLPRRARIPPASTPHCCRRAAAPLPPRPQKAAANKWASIITVDLPNAPAGTDYTAGEISGYKYTSAIDDVVIFYAVKYIDGNGGGRAAGRTNSLAT
jgi:hypothetical protein